MLSTGDGGTIKTDIDADHRELKVSFSKHQLYAEPHLLNQRGVKWQHYFWLPEGLPSMRTFRSQPKNISKLDHWQLVLIVSPVLRVRQSFKHKQGGIWPLPIAFLEDSSTLPKPELSLVAVTLLFGCLHPVGGGAVSFHIATLSYVGMVWPLGKPCPFMS